MANVYINGRVHSSATLVVAEALDLITFSDTPTETSATWT